MRAFFRWADSEGYSVDPRILQLRKVRIPRKEPTIFHIKQLNDILASRGRVALHTALVTQIQDKWCLVSD
jgi:hypothetical protein